MAVTNNLFPPTIETYMPAFLLDSGNPTKDICKIYFSISAYNTINEIANVQVTIVDQNTNISILDETKYPSGIKITEMYEDITKQTNDKYYITITKDDLKEKQFEINTYYKVQIRFTSTNASSLSNSIINGNQAIDSWLSENLANFSEWSTICLVHGISTPSLQLQNLDPLAEYTEWNSGNVDIVGNLTFLNKEEDETLRSYEIRVYDENEKEIINTGFLYGETYINVNQINYTFKYLFQEGKKYRINIHYITENLYEEDIDYNIIIIETGGKRLDAILITELDEENSRIGVHVRGNELNKYTGNVMIRRTDSKSNFTIWEDIHLAKIEDEPLDFIWYDNTIESGVWYSYCAQEINSLGHRSIIIKTRNPVLMVFDDMFLTKEKQQLKIKFNPQISSYQRTVSDNIMTTIGSKYPFVTRNGNMNYRQFQISGTISHFIDRDGLLISRDNMYESDDVLQLYDEYNDDKNIIPQYDYTYERDFREKVMDFLYSNDVKLFRSATEGNILVKLTNISFQPNQTVGRLIWNFSATVQEIADNTIENYHLYGVQSLDNKLNKFFTIAGSYLGQILEPVPANTNILSIIEEKYQKRANTGYITKVNYLDFLRLEPYGEPYLIKEGAQGPYKVEDDNTEGSILGYIAKINNKPFVLSPGRTLELKENGVKITSIVFPVETDVDLNYHVSLIETEKEEELPKAQNYYAKVGQCWGTFDYGSSIYKQIWDKYNESYSTYIQNLMEISRVNIEADPGTVVYVREFRETDFDRHIIGETCRLDFNDEDTLIEGIYFAGTHLEPATEQESKRAMIPHNKFIETGIIANSVEEIKKPIYNGVYTITNGIESLNSNDLNIVIIENETYDLSDYKKSDVEFYQLTKESANNRYIYYNDQWFSFNEDNDILCPVSGLVDYCCSIMRGIL